MVVDTYADMWGRLLLRYPNLDPKLAQDFIRNAFRRLWDRRRWSWKMGYGQFIAPALYNTGTATVTQNSTTVTGSGTTWTMNMVGRQFRIGTSTPIYTIAQFISATELALDSPWGAETATLQPYLIYQCFFPVPSDFHQFWTLWDPAFNWQLWLNINQSEITLVDAQRSNVGNAYCASFRDYTASQVGIVNTPLAVLGSGPSPISSGSYLGPADATFTIEITTGGVSGTAEYRWKKNSGSYTSGVVTDVEGSSQDLQDGVTVAFPTGETYVDGDIWIINCTAVSNPGVPRYELWPHQQSNHLYPYLYERIPLDISQPGAVLPRYVRGDVLVEMGMADVCLWPGTEEVKNPHFNPLAATGHSTRAEYLIGELELRDDEIWMQDLSYSYPATGWAFAAPFLDSAWLQRHAV